MGGRGSRGRADRNRTEQTVLTEPGTTPPPTEHAGQPDPTPPPAQPAAPLTTAQQDQAVYDAITEIQPRNDTWVSITELRAALTERGISDREQEEYLRRLDNEGKITMTPRSARMLLTDADHAAAIRIGGQDNHMVLLNRWRTEPPTGPRPERVPTPDPTPPPHRPDATRPRTELENRVRSAYDQLAQMPQDWVRLSRLRAMLGDADRDEVDRILLAMTRTGYVHLAPDSNRKAHTDADRAAAIRIGNEDRMLLAIEPQDQT